MKTKLNHFLLITGLVFFASSSAFLLAKENTKAETYKSYRVAESAKDKNVPVVYFTRDISSEGMLRLYDALGWKANGKTGVKISTGESKASNYLRPNLLKGTVQKVNGTIVECNTSYGGRRASNAMHKQLAKDHGFLEIAAFDLLDENGTMTLPVQNAKRLKNGNYVGSHFKNYNSYLVISHFKGH